MPELNLGDVPRKMAEAMADMLQVDSTLPPPQRFEALISTVREQLFQQTRKWYSRNPQSQRARALLQQMNDAERELDQDDPPTPRGGRPEPLS